MSDFVAILHALRDAARRVAESQTLNQDERLALCIAGQELLEATQNKIVSDVSVNPHRTFGRE